MNKRRFVYVETTQWADTAQPNHVYVFDSAPRNRSVLCSAYVPAGTDRVVKFSKPLSMDLKNRTFVPLT